MPRINKTRFALLGILSIRSASGYDIKKMMSISTQHFWREGDSSIYPILKQLLKEEWVTCELVNEMSDKPKKVYTITIRGKDELEKWLIEEPILIQNRSEFMLKIFFGWNVDITITIHHIEKFRRQVKIVLEKYRRRLNTLDAKPSTPTQVYELLTHKAGIAQYEASLHWSNDALKVLRTNLHAFENTNNKLTDHF